MSDPAFDTAPGFDQPIAVLKHCHDKIRRQLATLDKLLAHLPVHGADAEAGQAAGAVLQYFTRAAPNHHADEEENLLPMLRETAVGDDAALIADLAPQILHEHQQMDAQWHVLEAQLRAIADRQATQLSPDAVHGFIAAYTAHMSKEESHIAPMAKRLFSSAQMAFMGAAMQQRRGIAVTVGVAPAADASADAGPSASGQPALAHQRIDYGRASLTEAETDADPVAQFQRWFGDALAAKAREANAMCLSTVAGDGRPSSRIVLIKDFDARGFTWYTNYDSRKGEELAQQPFASLLFFWSELERQVRIEGRIEKVSSADSDAYFAIRPLQSRQGAIASQQSRPIADRAALEQRFAEVAAASGAHPARPAHWGGYRLVPDRIEFWQGRSSRLHDRILYTLQADGNWLRSRLQP